MAPFVRTGPNRSDGVGIWTHVAVGRCVAGEPPTAFFTLLTTATLTAADQGADLRIIVAYLLLIATMVHGHPASAAAFLRESANLQFVRHYRPNPLQARDPRSGLNVLHRTLTSVL